jgi:hypothetical protein
MSLHLPDQKLGSHSSPGSSSHKFMLKGRQSGGVHRGHAWVFRAESYDTMLAWYDDIKNLTEKTGAERTAFIREHARSISGGSTKALSVSDDGVMDEDEADQVPYSATASQRERSPIVEQRLERPNPGGRFPSTIAVDRNSQVALPPPSPSSSEDHNVAGGLEPRPGHSYPDEVSSVQAQRGDDTFEEIGTSGMSDTNLQSNYTPISQMKEYNGLPVHQGPLPVTLPGTEYHTDPVNTGGVTSGIPGLDSYGATPTIEPESESTRRSFIPPPSRHESKYGDWMAPTTGAGGPALGAGSFAAYRHNEEEKDKGAKGPAETERDLPVERTTSGQIPTTTKTVQQEPQHFGTEPYTSPTSTSTQPLSSTTDWAPGSSQSEVAEPNQFISTGGTPTAVDTSNADPFATQSLRRPVADEQTGPDPARDPAGPIKALANRPALRTQDSAATISDLHVPGEYPKTNPGTDGY